MPPRKNKKHKPIPEEDRVPDRRDIRGLKWEFCNDDETEIIWIHERDVTAMVYGTRNDQTFNASGVPEEPCAYLDPGGTRVPFETAYAAILRPAQPGAAERPCRNSKLKQNLFLQGRDEFSSVELQTYLNGMARRATYGTDIEPWDIGIVHAIFAIAKSSLLERCSCSLEPDVLQLIPRCPSWPGFDNWVIQFVACGSSTWSEWVQFPNDRQYEYVQAVVEVLSDAIYDSQVGRQPAIQEVSDWQLHPEYHLWESTVDLVEVCAVVSWLARAFDNYKFLHPIEGLDSIDGHIVQAFERAESLGLCPQRVWAIAQANPFSGSLSLYSLVPAMDSPPRGWRHTGHESCTADSCEHARLNFTTVQQLHLCPSKDCSKDPSLFPTDKLDGAVQRQIESNTYVPTAWALDGRSMIEVGVPFLAISHVWSDGTGAGIWERGVVNICLWEFFCEVARELDCKGIWWDAICLPKNKSCRIAALNTMHLNYEYASTTLVHDRYLSTFEWVGAAEACFAVIMSSWFTRGWTALELERSREHPVKVLFSQQGFPVLKDLDTEILAQSGQLSHAYHCAASEVIRNIRNEIRNIDQLLSALGPRYTSWSKDKAIIAGLLVCVDDPASMTEQQVYQAILRRMPTIHSGHLFHGKTTMHTSGFTWCPANLFELALNQSFEPHSLQIVEDGGLLGDWYLCCIETCRNVIAGPVEGTHRLIRARLALALANHGSHMLLLPGISHIQGLIVKTKLDKCNSNPIRCELVGAVELQKERSELRWMGRRSVLIGDIADLAEMPPGTHVCEVLFPKEL